MPVPPQWWHWTLPVPGSALLPMHRGQVSDTLSSTSLSQPLAACSNVRFMVTCCDTHTVSEWGVLHPTRHTTGHIGDVFHWYPPTKQHPTNEEQLFLWPFNPA